MKILLKVIFYLIVIFLVLLVCASIALHFILKPETLKRVIISQVQANTGRTLTIGKLDYKLFPTFQLDLADIALSDNPAFSKASFLTIDKMNLGVKLRPLLNNQIILTGINVQHIQLNLIQNSSGNNWQMLIGKPLLNKTTNSSSTTTTTRIKQTNTTKTSYYYTKNNTSLDIPSINLKDLNVNYQSNGTVTSLKNLYFIANDIRNNQTFFNFDAGSNVTQTNPSLNLNWQISGKAAISPNFMQYQLSDTDISGRLITDQEAKKVVLTDLATTIKILPTQILINPFSATFYSAKIAGDASLTTKGIPSYQLYLNIVGLNLKDLLTDLGNVSKMSGTANFQTHLTSLGQTSQQLTANLTGNGSFAINQAQLEGFDIGLLYKNALALLQHGKFSDPDFGDNSKMGNLTGNYKVSQGVISTDDTKYISPVIRAEMDGDINLNTQLIKMTANVTPVKGSLDHLQDNGPTIPFEITGSFKRVHAIPNLAGLVKNAIQQQVNNEIAKVKMQIPDISNRLKGLLGN